MLLLDIDDFKAINDRFGHVEADVLLRDIGARLREALPGSVVIGRLGGDEFAALLDPADDPAGIAVRSAGALIDALRKPFPIAGVEVFVTTSVGIALGKDVDQLFRRADVAMYRAKSAGKAQYALYAPWMDDAVLGRLELLGELRQARPDEDFLLHYQPVLDLATRELLGVEALLRWRHPTRGIVQPVDFIPIAEESGLIVPVGRWVLEQACRQVAAWRDAPDGHELTVSVNVSARQLQHPEFVHDVRVALDAAALDPRRLVLEITEGAVVGDHARRLGDARGAAADGRRPRARRLRDRLLVALDARDPAVRHAEARPRLRQPARGDAVVGAARPGDRGSRRRPRARGGRRRDRDGAAGRRAPSPRRAPRPGVVLQPAARAAPDRGARRPEVGGRGRPPPRPGPSSSRARSPARARGRRRPRRPRPDGPRDVP